MKKTFLAHFVLCLAVAAGAWLAHLHGEFAAIWAADQSYMTSAIGALFVIVSLWLAAEAWKGDAGVEVDTHIGYLAAELCLVFGVIGMVAGLAKQGAAIAVGGNAVFAAWAQQLNATLVGCAACAVLLMMAYNVERGARR